LPQQFGAGRVDVAVVDGQIPHAPVSQLLCVVPLYGTQKLTLTPVASHKDTFPPRSGVINNFDLVILA